MAPCYIPIKAALFALGCAFAIAAPSANPGGVVLDVYHRPSLDLDLARRANQYKTKVLRANAGFLANMTVGGKSVEVLLDTGSANFWLAAPKYAGSGPQTWDPQTASNTALKQGWSFRQTYTGFTSASGSVYQTRACLGGGCISTVVGSATQIDYPSNLNEGFAGILGLGFGGGSTYKPNPQPNIIQALAANGNLAAPIFVTNFHGRYSQVAGGLAIGYNPFGGAQPFQSIVVQKAPTDHHPYTWTYQGAQFFKNGGFLGASDLWIDTGTSLIVVTPDIARGYLSGIPNWDGKSLTAPQFPCSQVLPDLTLRLGGATMVIPGFAMFGGLQKAPNANRCYAFIDGSSSGGAIMGTPFFIAHTVIWNVQSGQLSWANQQG